MTRGLSQDRFKICNICGDDCEVYTVDRNAIICKSCRPITKKIPNEKQMFENILNKNKKL